MVISKLCMFSDQHLGSSTRDSRHSSCPRTGERSIRNSFCKRYIRFNCYTMCNWEGMFRICRLQCSDIHQPHTLRYICQTLYAKTYSCQYIWCKNQLLQYNCHIRNCRVGRRSSLLQRSQVDNFLSMFYYRDFCKLNQILADNSCNVSLKDHMFRMENHTLKWCSNHHLFRRLKIHLHQRS